MLNIAIINSNWAAEDWLYRLIPHMRKPAVRPGTPRRFGSQKQLPEAAAETLSDRIARLVDYLADVYEYNTSVRRVSERQKAHQPLIREQQDTLRLFFRRRLESSLPEAVPKDEPGAGSCC